MLRSRFNLSGFALVTSLMLSGGSAFAEYSLSANGVMPGCRGLMAGGDTAYVSHGRCVGLIEGVLYRSREREICAPAEVTNGQLVRVVMQYIDASPARMHEDFRKLAVEAMRAAWPCRR